jgi:predicted PurR-regulated permease PerM
MPPATDPSRLPLAGSPEPGSPATAPPEAAEPDETPAPAHAADRVQAVAAMGLLVLGVLYTLYVARDFLLPIVLAILLKFLLAPVPRALRRLRIPEAASAFVVLVLLVGGLGFVVSSLVDPASEWMARAPDTARQVAAKLRPLKGPVEQVSRATAEVKEIADLTPDRGDDKPVAVRQTTLGRTLLGSTWRFVANLVIMLVLLYFLLASGDSFLRKMIKVLPGFRNKVRAVEIAHAIERDVSGYLATVTLVNVAFGAAVTLALWALGMPNALLWGALAAVTNYIPYLGAMLMLALLTVVALLSFDDPGRALLVPGAFFALNLIEGYFATPMAVGRRLTLSPVAVFVGVLFWSWIWGIPGAILAVPILATLKIFCDHIEPLQPVGDFLGH